MQNKSFSQSGFLNFTLAINNFRFNKHRLEKPKIFQEYIENIFNRYPNSGHLFP